MTEFSSPPATTPTSSLPLELAGEQITLHAGRGMAWPKACTLFIADPHFGKAATFRLSGIPVPESTHQADLQRLTRLLRETRARRLIILGDFFHAQPGRNESTHTALEQWRDQWPRLHITLIIGNHDRRAGPPHPSLGIETIEGPCLLPPFAACHEPQPVPGHFVLAGHLHPGYRIAAHTAPCFHVTTEQMIFPAFGTFTGTTRVKPAPRDRIYLVGQHEVIALPLTSPPRSSKNHPPQDPLRSPLP